MNAPIRPFPRAAKAAGEEQLARLSSLRILHVINSLDPTRGGPIEGLKHISRQLLSAGWHPEVLTIDPPDAAWLADFPCPVHAVGPGLLRYRYTSRALPWLREHVRDFAAVVVHGLWQFHGFAAWLALRGSGIPYFVYCHGMLDPWFKQQYPLKHVKKWLYWPWAEYRLLRDAAAVLFTCEEESRLAPQSFWLYRSTHRVVGYGISPPDTDATRDRAAFLDAFPSLRSKRLILFLSRINEKKGCDLLIEAFAAVASEHASLHLIMAGPEDTALGQALRKLATRLGVGERITWAGMLSGAQKWGAFHASEVFVLPSHQENFGIAVVEALACGRPVLISDKVNIWREIDAGGAALVERDDRIGTRRLLERWLSMDESQRQRMAQNATPTFRRHFHIQASFQRLLNVLVEVTH